MIKAIFVSFILGTAGILAGVWVYNHYTILGTSLVSNEELEKINEYGRVMAMQGYMLGAQAGAESCKSHT